MPTNRRSPSIRAQSSERPIAKGYAQILAAYQAEMDGYREAAAKAAISGVKPAVPTKRPPDLDIDYSRRMVDLAESSPADPVARDALLWVLNKPGRAYQGEFGDQFARAAALLVRHHGDDPEAVRIGLTLHHQVTPALRRDLAGVLRRGQGPRGEGAGAAGPGAIPRAEGRDRSSTPGASRAGPSTAELRGGKVVREFDLTYEEYAYHLELRQCDPQAHPRRGGAALRGGDLRVRRCTAPHTAVAASWRRY